MTRGKTFVFSCSPAISGPPRRIRSPPPKLPSFLDGRFPEILHKDCSLNALKEDYDLIQTPPRLLDLRGGSEFCPGGGKSVN